jgi:hypothetical protein
MTPWINILRPFVLGVAETGFLARRKKVLNRVQREDIMELCPRGVRPQACHS